MQIHFSCLLLLLSLSLPAQDPTPDATSGKGITPFQNQQTKNQNPETFAVVVGISDYQDEGIPDLRFADKDALAFAGFLQSPAGGGLDEDHLKVLLNEQATAAQFAIALDWLWEVVQENDQVIIYFSGHGDVERKSITQPGYLLCWDAPARVYMAGGTFGVNVLNDVVSTLSIQNKARVALITDACRAGKLSGSGIDGAQATAANLAKQYANEIKILSCQPDEYSLEGEQWGGGRGAFSYHLVDGLYGLADRNGDGTVNLMELRGYLEERVSEEVAPESQLPMTVGNGRQELAQVYPELLDELQQGRSGQLQMFTATESRGIEDEVLAPIAIGADSNVVDMYLAFQQAIADGQFLEPESACADYYYEKLSREPQLERLHSSMRRNYAAALQDDAQQVMNNWMKLSLSQTIETKGEEKEQEELIPKKRFSPEIKTFPAYLERAAELLGREHYMYNVLQARKHFFRGYLLANSNRNPNQELGQQALAEFRQALDLEPELPLAYWQMSLAFGYNLLQPDSAELYARQALERAPYWVNPYTDLAYMLSQKYKQFDRAKAFLDRAMQLDSNSLYIWKGWGSYYNLQKKYALAEKSYERTLQIDSNHIFTYNDLAGIYVSTARYDLAEEHYKKLIQRDSTIDFAYKNLGNLYRKMGRHEEAERQYKKSLQINPEYLFTFLDLGKLHKKKGEYEEAEKYLKKALQIDSTLGYTHLALGVLYTESGQFDQAEEIYKKLLQFESTAFAYEKTGDFYMYWNKNEKAERCFKKALQIDSTYIYPYGDLGFLYYHTGRHKEAERTFKKALQIDSTYVLALSGLGVVYNDTDRPEEAMQAMQKYIQIDSTDAMAYYTLGLIHSKSGLPEKAVQYMEKAIQMDSTQNFFYNDLGAIYIDLPQLEKAEELFKKAIVLSASDWRAYSNLGLLYHLLGRWEDAAAMTQKAIELFPHDGGLHAELAYALSYLPSRLEEANLTFEKAVELSPNWPDTYFYWAQFILRSEGESEESRSLSHKYLRKAFENGVGKKGVLDPKGLKTRKDFEILRKEPIWNQLMQNYFPDQHKKTD